MKTKIKKQIKKNKTKKNNINNKKISRLINENKLKDPNKLRIGHVSKSINKIKYIVKLDLNGNKYYTEASKEEIACDIKLKENISKFISIYKSGNSSFKSMKNAIAYAINQTDKEFDGKCLNTKIDKSIKKNNVIVKNKFELFIDKIKQYTSNIYNNYFYFF